MQEGKGRRIYSVSLAVRNLDSAAWNCGIYRYSKKGLSGEINEYLRRVDTSAGVNQP